VAIGGHIAVLIDEKAGTRPGQAAGTSVGVGDRSLRDDAADAKPGGLYDIGDAHIGRGSVHRWLRHGNSRRRGTLPRQHPCRPQSCGGNRQNEGENNACRDEESSATAVLSNVEGAHLPFSLIDAVATVKEEDGPHPIFRKRHLMPLIRRSKHSWCVGFSSPPSR
jgi:hypothetical protein